MLPPQVRSAVRGLRASDRAGDDVGVSAPPPAPRSEAWARRDVGRASASTGPRRPEGIRRRAPARRRRRGPSASLRRPPVRRCRRAWCSTGLPRATAPRARAARTPRRTAPPPTSSLAAGRSGTARSRRAPPRSAPRTYRSAAPRNFTPGSGYGRSSASSRSRIRAAATTFPFRSKRSSAVSYGPRASSPRPAACSTSPFTSYPWPCQSR